MEQLSIFECINGTEENRTLSTDELACNSSTDGFVI